MRTDELWKPRRPRRGVLVAEGSEAKATPGVWVQLVAALGDDAISPEEARKLSPLRQRVEPPNHNLRRRWGTARGFRVVRIRLNIVGSIA